MMPLSEKTFGNEYKVPVILGGAQGREESWQPKSEILRCAQHDE
jgi:hypothetical protein